MINCKNNLEKKNQENQKLLKDNEKLSLYILQKGINDEKLDKLNKDYEKLKEINAALNEDYEKIKKENEELKDKNIKLIKELEEIKQSPQFLKEEDIENIYQTLNNLKKENEN